MSQQQWVLGIDGGGTKTDAVLVAGDGTIGAMESAGPSNLYMVGIQRAAQVILELVEKCCEQGMCRPESLHRVGVGLAGAGRANDRIEFHRHLLELGPKHNLPLPDVLVETDWRIALEGALAGAPGIVLIAGTGSIACAKDEDGKLYRAGGWGNILGDEGSGFALSRDALNAALRAHEGRGDHTLLLEFALQHFAASSVDELMDKVYRDQPARPDPDWSGGSGGPARHRSGGQSISSFVPKLLQAEAQGDHVARDLLLGGANELADLLCTLENRLDPNAELPVALMGGLLENENTYSKMVKEKIRSAIPRVVFQKPKFSPAYGAAILAFSPVKFPL